MPYESYQACLECLKLMPSPGNFSILLGILGNLPLPIKFFKIGVQVEIIEGLDHEYERVLSLYIIVEKFYIPSI